MKTPWILGALLSTLAGAALLLPACGGGAEGGKESAGGSGGATGGRGGGAASAGMGGGAARFTLLYQPPHNDAGDVPAVFSIAGQSPTDVWVTGQYGMAAHFQGGQWTPVPTGARGSLTSLTVVATDRAFALDWVYGIVYGWDGQAWSALSDESGSRLAIWADGPQSLWSVGGVEEHWDGQTWKVLQMQHDRWFGAVAGTSATNLIAAGEMGGILRFDGTSWTDHSLDNVADELGAVYAASPQDAWLVGGSGTVVHWNGTAGTVSHPGGSQALNSVSGTGTNDVWVGSKGGTLLHWNGTAWTSTATPSGNGINCVWAARPGEVWFGDATGAVTSYRP